jgi:hypothetical protein
MDGEGSLKRLIENLLCLNSVRFLGVWDFFLAPSRFACLFAACCEYPVYNIYLAIKRTREPHGI